LVGGAGASFVSRHPPPKYKPPLRHLPLQSLPQLIGYLRLLTDGRFEVSSEFILLSLNASWQLDCIEWVRTRLCLVRSIFTGSACFSSLESMQAKPAKIDTA
jgi:hypothetical protein